MGSSSPSGVVEAGPCSGEAGPGEPWSCWGLEPLGGGEVEAGGSGEAVGVCGVRGVCGVSGVPEDVGLLEADWEVWWGWCW